MRKYGYGFWPTLLVCIIVLSIFLTSCGGAAPTQSNPIVVLPNQVSANNANSNYVNILINSVKFNGAVSNGGDEGKLQLFTVVSDDAGHADALICPYGNVMLVHQGDQVNPCQAGLTYPEDLLQDHLFVMLIALDVKDTSAATDIGFNGLSAALGTGLELAIQTLSEGAIAATAPAAIVGVIALDTVLGYAGSKTEQYFQKNYVIGSQSFVLSRKYNWNNGQSVSADSTNGQVNFTFDVQKSSTVEGKIVEAAPAPTSEPATVAPAPQTENSDNMTGQWTITLNVTDVIPGDGMTQTCANPTNVVYDF